METDGAGAGSGEDQQRRDVLSFCGVTSASREVALFFLESHNWILDAAIASFYEQEDQDQDLDLDLIPPRPSPPRSRVDADEEEEEEDEDKDDEDYMPAEDDDSPPPPNPRLASAKVDKKPAKPSGSRSNIRTFADLSRNSGDSDSDEEPQGYYTGGEKSGMLVQDPKKVRHNVDSLFEHARQMGAMPGPFEPQSSSSSRSFTGTGRLLSGATVQTSIHQHPVIIHNIYFWINGFTVDDGPLRRFGDPENASFLESIARSECPDELKPANKSYLVKVNLTRREEEYTEHVGHPAAFQGSARMLGSGSSSSPISETAVSSDNVPKSSVGFSVDDSKPSTSIQLRLADGTRMVARFNTHHTVGDIRAFIDSSRPGAARTYQLQTVGFPPKQLNDLSQTIEEAALSNSVVIQRL